MNFLKKNSKRHGIYNNTVNREQLFNIKLVVSLLVLLVSTIGFAQQGVNYQGVARDAEGQLLSNTEIDLKFNIKINAPDGDAVYSETFTVMTDINGVFSTVIGEGTPVLNLIENVNWAEDRHFLNVWLNNEEIGTTEFMATPYANAMGKWQAHVNGVTPKGTGGSIYIGDDAGEEDELVDNHNIGLGENALNENTEGKNNVALGFEALKINRGGNHNVAIGKQSLDNNITGNSNIALGGQSMGANTVGSHNIAFGWQSLLVNTEGNNNIAFGEHAMVSNTIGNNNFAGGYRSLFSNTEGVDNIALGYRALRDNTLGSDNIAFGHETLFSNTDGVRNIAFGPGALYSNQTGGNNFASGYNTLHENTSGGGNIGIGLFAMHENISGNHNVALGGFSLRDHISGDNNVSVGYRTMWNNETGEGNIALGEEALILNTIGDFNTVIGTEAGHDALGDRNVFIGYRAGYHEEGSNKLYIDNSSVTTPLIYGDFETNQIGLFSKVGINMHHSNVPLNIVGGFDVTLDNPSGQLVLGLETGSNLALDNNEIQARNNETASDLYLQNEGGNVRVGGAIVHASDRRLKRDIDNISYGLNDILKLRPTEYFWKGKNQEYKSLGLIAQEVESVIENVVTYDKEEDKYGVSYTELIPVLIKALQEQQDIINKQNKTIESFENRLSALERDLSNK
ncbi:tail fiber domain-containing protein [uncultured Psychroserpens sp.]|uniref:tail fiber domain-containing protein n=1 Tax=uncultured Psychroserpens sp. TaxID=255436 RepID=UPI002632C237|nr:tail fiber domain-containing protein [uncultured Psychroserpens sp.]